MFEKLKARIVVALADRAIDQMAAKAGNNFSLEGAWQTMANVRDWTFDMFCTEAYKGNSAVAGCIKNYQFAFPEPRLRVVDKKTGDEIENHPLQIALDMKGNKFIDQKKLLAKTITHMTIGGYSAWHILRNSYGEPVGFKPYSGSQMKPVPSRDEDIAYWLYFKNFNPLYPSTQTGIGEPIPFEDVILIGWPTEDPQREYIPCSPLLAIVQDTDMDTELGRMCYALVKNMNVPPFILAFGEKASDKFIEAIQERLKQRFGGTNRGTAMVAKADVFKVEKVGFSLKEMGIDVFRDVPETRIAGNLMIDPTIVGFNVSVKEAQSKPYKQIYAKWYRTTLVPLWKIVEGAITNMLCVDGRAYGKPDYSNVRIEFDLSTVTMLQERDYNEDRGTTEEWQADILTLDEVRDTLGYDPCEDKERGKKYFSELKLKAVAPESPSGADNAIGNDTAIGTTVIGEDGKPVAASKNGKQKTVLA